MTLKATCFQKVTMCALAPKTCKMTCYKAKSGEESNYSKCTVLGLKFFHTFGSLALRLTLLARIITNWSVLFKNIRRQRGSKIKPNEFYIHEIMELFNVVCPLMHFLSVGTTSKKLCSKISLYWHPASFNIANCSLYCFGKRQAGGRDRGSLYAFEDSCLLLVWLVVYLSSAK